jgi:hypothetical protein
VTGNLEITGNASTGDLNLGSLTNVAGSVNVADNGSTGNLDLGSLAGVTGNLEITGNASTGDLNLGSLTNVAGSVNVADNGSTGNLDLGSLSSVGGDVNVDVADDAESVDASGLGPGGGEVVMEGGSNGGTTINVGDLADMTGTLTITGAGGVTVTAEAGLEEVTTTGSEGDDTVTGSATAENTMDGGGGNDDLTGGAAADDIDGGEGDDTLEAGDGDDQVAGGEGDDTVVGGHGGGDDIYDGGTGNDSVTYTSTTLGVTVDLAAGTATGPEIGSDTLIEIENATGGSGDDRIGGSAADNKLGGGDGTDTVVFTGERRDYTIEAIGDPNEYRVTDNRVGGDGTDIVTDFELFEFSDVTLAEADILNTAPAADADGPYAVDEDAPLSVDAANGVLNGDSDLEGNPLTAELVSGPANALSFTLNPDGSFSYQGVADFNGPDSFTYRAFDGTASSDEITVQIDVAPVNDAPVLANAIADQNATEDAPFSFAVPADTFADVDAADALALTATLAGGGPLPAWLSFDQATGKFSGTPLNDDVGAIAVRVTATDGALASAFDDFTLTVANTNDAPTANPDEGSAGENETKNFDVLGNDTDPDTGDTRTLISIGAVSVSSVNAAVHGMIAASALVMVGNQIQFNPGTLFDPLNAGETATVAVAYTMQDAAGVASSSTLTLTVNGAAETPAFNVINGTPGNDRNLNGTAAADLVNGLAGNDIIDAKGGDDLIVAGAGQDLVEAGGGNDTVMASINDGTDLYFGESGSDTFDFSQTGAAATVSLGTTIFGFTLNDIGHARSSQIGIDLLHSFENATGGSGNDNIAGNDLANVLRGGAGDDTIAGLRGDDRLYGDAGLDKLTGGRGSDWMAGGADADTFVFQLAQSHKSDVDVIDDFVLSQDHLLFQGLSVAALAESDVNGDTVLDTALTLTDGARVQLLNLSGVSDWHNLL